MIVQLAAIESLQEVAKEGATDEYTDYLVYKHLAESRRTKDPKLKAILNKLSSAEYKHYEFWRKYSPEKEIRPSMSTVYLTLFLRFIFGVTFATKYLEKHEDDVVKRYKSVSHLIPESDKSGFDEMVADEVEHEEAFLTETEGKYIKYISFVVLGLADAIVEISGIHAGSLGIYDRTDSPDSLASLRETAVLLRWRQLLMHKAKQGFQGSASISASFTGISYFVSAIILATPYFLTKVMYIALGTSFTLAILIIAFISYYNSIISESHFLRDFLELAGITVGVYRSPFRVWTGNTICFRNNNLDEPRIDIRVCLWS